MNDQLFTHIPVQFPDRLTAARAEMVRAQAAWDDCREMDGSPIRQRLGNECAAARYELQQAELERLHNHD